MAQVLCHIPPVKSEKLIVGLETSDDAAVYKLDDEKAIIQTLDFFTPIVDDPYMFGQIAAANSLSDVYAMGGEPTLALNIVGFPSCLDINILGEIMKGGYDKVNEAGAILVGGHTIEDNEPKYGLSVTGIVHPDKVLSNSNAKPGDYLVLTKPIGTGIINTAIKAGLADDKTISDAIDIMASLNKIAAEGMKLCKVNSCTDITGFGLLGHIHEMAKGSGVTIEVASEDVPILDKAKEYASMGLVPAGAYRNKGYIKDDVVYNESIDEALIDIFYDPQTSGGLLISLSEDELSKLLAYYDENLPTDFAIVGRVKELDEKHIIVL